ncbi:hypothetical protein [Paenibacillus polymyxa]|uniref:hypothetical protein n=1 Tax=Paenibacillus polymyxa TaxID=1406 RepID=UPI0005EC39E2|nr:hypothetical protein [Paenibacillus polymyxa]KJK28449.1 hypothetical protein TY89_23025 [Paenibacillus polymyxa]
MNLKKDRKELENLRKLKKYYAKFKSKELELLKASYEAKEEDNKQIGVVLLLITAIVSYANLFINNLPKVTEFRSITELVGLFVGLVVILALFKYLISNRNIRTSVNRRAIDIVLAERAATKAKQNPPTPTP